MISVVIPTYNRRELLGRAVQSVLCQTEKDLEVIIVDDGSDDGTEEAVRELTERDARVRYARQNRQGACAARNLGVRMARGEWVAFQDSDDTWREDKLACQLRQLRDTDADIVFCAFERHLLGREDRQVFPHAEIPAGRIRYEDLLFENLISTQTMMGRRTCFADTPFDPRFPRLQDWELVLRLAKKYDIRYFDEVLADVYEQSDSISRHPERAVAALRMLYGKHHAAINRSAILTERMHNAIRSACEECGMATTVWREDFRALSWRRPFRMNVTYFRMGLGMLRRRLTGRNAEDKKEKDTHEG